jgi:dTDP-4-dehydrorhamnose reductase
MRILITGANGQLGRSLQRALLAHDVIALAHEDLDITDAEAVRATIDEHRPDAVIHTAALTDTWRCEREPAAAEAVNALGAGHLASATARIGARCLLVSTNEVFDGANHNAYSEMDEPHPLNAYGVSKLRGEQLAAAACGGALIVRTSWLYGVGGANFVEKVRAAGQSGQALRFVTDEIAAPTSSADLADGMRSLLERNAPAGLYHLANDGESSRYEWAREVVRLAGMRDVPVEGVTTAQLRANGYSGPQKPPYSVLANTRARALGITLRPWRGALAAYFEDARVAADG